MPPTRKRLTRTQRLHEVVHDAWTHSVQSRDAERTMQAQPSLHPSGKSSRYLVAGVQHWRLSESLKLGPLDFADWNALQGQAGNAKMLSDPLLPRRKLVHGVWNRLMCEL